MYADSDAGAARGYELAIRIYALGPQAAARSVPWEADATALDIGLMIDRGPKDHTNIRILIVEYGLL